MFQNEAPVTQTQYFLAKLRDIQKASLQSDCQGKFNLSLDTMFRGMGAGNSFYDKQYFLLMR